MKKMMKKLMGVVLALVFAVSGVLASAGTQAHAMDGGYETYRYNDYDIIYSDNFFNYPATMYNEHLATLSMHMTNFTCPAGGIKKDASEDDKNAWYESQPNKLFGFFETIGFDTCDCNEDYRKATAFDTIGVAAAKKEINGNTVIALTIRSAGYFREWGNNVFLGDGTNSDYMHEGWYNAANKAITFLKEYIAKNNISGNIKLWVSGFSRGGATANLIAGLLDNELANGNNTFGNAVLMSDNLYAYTFEAPQGANINSVTVRAPKDAIYNNIWNIVNPNDLVPKVAMSEWGFTRFGQDKYIKTKFYDPNGFAENRKTLKAFYTAMGNSWNDYKADDLTVYGMQVENVLLQLEKLNALAVGIKMDYDFITKDETKANYDANIVSTLFVEELVKSAGTRENYHNTLEKGFSDLLVYFMEDIEGLGSEKYESTKNSLITAGIVGAVITAVTGNPGVGLMMIDGVLKLTGTPAIQITEEMLLPLLKVVGATYWERPNELITIAMQAENIFQNHDQDVIIAHMEAQDSLYIDWYNGSHPSETVERVSLMDDASFVHATFFGFNDLGYRIGNLASGLRTVNVDGHLFGRSDVLECQPGNAVGYYSYATEEKMELFTNNIYSPFTITMMSYSKKPQHTVRYKLFYQYVGMDNHYKTKLELNNFEKEVNFNSERYIDENSHSAYELLNLIY